LRSKSCSIATSHRLDPRFNGRGANARPAQQAALAAKKGVEMNTFKMISEKFYAWRRYRDAVRELSHFSDHELCDIGIRRCDIEDIVRSSGPRNADR
jgi:uncharacterized protein YjiS (DUF1127 family)